MPPPGTQGLDGEKRIGERAMELFADPLKVSILRHLARGSLRSPELSSRLGGASRTTRFGRLRQLEELGVIGRDKRGGSPPSTVYMLTPGGIEMLAVARRFAAWLRGVAGEPGARSRIADMLAIKALAAGWGTSVLRWLAEHPRSVTELAVRGAPEVSYHDVRRACEALAGAGLIEPIPSEARGKPYVPTRLGREAVGPLAAAVRWERQFLVGGAEPVTEVETSTLLFLAAPMVDGLPATSSGICSLLVEDAGGIEVAVKDGRVVSWGPPAVKNGGCLVCGPVSAWLDALLDGPTAGLKVEGERRLAVAVANGFRAAWSGKSLAQPSGNGAEI